VKRTWTVAAGLVMSGATTMGCGGSPAATTTTSAPAYTGSALSWLSAKARPINKTLNDDQAVVDVASAATGEIDPSTYFGRLASACTRLADDARQAGQVQAAPTASLAAAWLHRVARTETYASDCLDLAHTRSNAALTRWNQGLKAMNSANGSLNSQVNAIRSGSTAPAG
jgi:fructose-1,6-bisphosphatase/inositol monophosphatase family enzyme